ncbi:unnamed protein product [Ectocarpus sp. CCAP 1310/34]|nr:unnamed protein product [Ectocarpus sp. CCAP 1310/34]
MTGDEGNDDASTPPRSRVKGKAQGRGDKPSKWARAAPPSPGFDTADIEAATRNSLLSLGGKGGGCGGSSRPDVVDLTNRSQGGGADGARRAGGRERGGKVAHAPLEPHQAELFERVKAAVDHPSFASNRAKLADIAREAATAKGIGGEASTDDVLREACREYDLHRVNYVHAHEFHSQETTIGMTRKWESEMGVGSAFCGSVRAKVNRHEWDNGALRLLISGERLSASALKYTKGLQKPPIAARARRPHQLNGRVANDGPAWNVPAGLVLVGADAIDTVGSETYVWRMGDPYRSSRELHEAILALDVLGGLVWCPESVGLNQKVGGTFTDEQRSRGGNSVESCIFVELEAGKEGERCEHIEKWGGGAVPDLRPGAAPDAWVALLRSHTIRRRVGAKVKTVHKGALSPWVGNAASGRSLKDAQGVDYVTEREAGAILKSHNSLYKEWLKKNTNNK